MNKFAAGLLTAFVCVLAFLWWFGGKVERGEIGNALYTAEKKDAKAEIADSDKDGLRDWEERLWGTDIHSTDSDGDGTGDGEEVALGRDPKKKSPGDTLSNKEDIARAAIHESVSEGGGTIIPTTEDLKPTLTYTAFDIHTVDSKDQAFLINYGASLRTNLRPLSTGFGSAASNTIAVLSKKDSGSIERIKAEETLLITITKELLVLDVPESASVIHLKLLNSLTELAELAYTMEQVEREPAFALASAEAYEKKKPELLAVLGEINAYFKGEGVRFDSKNAVTISL